MTHSVRVHDALLQSPYDRGAIPALGPGLAVSNLKGVLGGSGEAGAGLGVLGFLAAVNGTTTRLDVVLVSNHHVLHAHGAKPGETVYQPAFSREGDNCVFHTEALNPVAELLDRGGKDHHLYSYPGEPERPYFVDCAAARVFIEHGVRIGPKLPPPGVRGKVVLKGVGRIHPLDVRHGRGPRVYIIGATTGIIPGRVVSVDAAVDTIEGGRRWNNIVIRVDRQSGALVGAGDSGALVVNERLEAVGLLWGKSEEQRGEAYACHIHPVLNRLGVTLITHDPFRN